jgi:mRNA-degrading endonuclease toxin of MazEF toxin-antitoxin module
MSEGTRVRDAQKDAPTPKKVTVDKIRIIELDAPRRKRNGRAPAIVVPHTANKHGRHCRIIL